MSTAAPRATYGALLATPGARQLFGLSLANVVGSALQILTLSVFVYSRTGSAFWSSTAFAAGFLPQLIGGSLLTSLVDRWPAKPVLLAGASARALVAGVLALGGLGPFGAIALVAAVAMFQPLPSAAQSALVARLLSGELYVLGRSVFNIISSAGQLAGLALGGTVVAVLGTHPAFGVAAGVQLLGLVGILLLPPVERRVAPTQRWHPRETWHGNAMLLADRVVRRILLSWWVPMMLLVAAESLVVAYVGERHGTASHTGLLLAAFPAGSAVGDLLVGRWMPPRWRRRSVPWLLALVGLGLLPFAWHPPTAVAIACFALACAGTSYQLGGQRAFLDAVPRERQGLAFGLNNTGIMGVQGLGPVLAGMVADALGAGVTITGLGVAVLASWLVIGRLPEPAPGTDRPVEALASTP